MFGGFGPVMGKFNSSVHCVSLQYTSAHSTLFYTIFYNILHHSISLFLFFSALINYNLFNKYIDNLNALLCYSPL